MRRVIRTACLGVLLAAGPAALSSWAAERQEARYEMEVVGVAPDPGSGAPLLFLRATQDKRELSIYIGPSEAQAVALPLQGLVPPRPLTHDLALNIIRSLEARLTRVVITALKEQTYHAELILEAHGKEIPLDCRPSDAVALALRAQVPIWAAEPAFARPPRPGPAGVGRPRTP